MTWLKISIMLLYVMALGACASSGVEVTQVQAASLQKGVTTYSDVVARFGKPTSVTLRSDGSRIAIYVYAHSQVRPASFVPVVGMLAGGADIKSNMVQLIFDRDSKLTDYTASESNTGVGTGLIGGGTYREPTDQPREAPKP